MARLTGANKEYINKTIPHIASLMASSLDVLLKDCEVIVIGNHDAEFKDIPARVSAEQTVYDFVRILGKFKHADNYIAIA